MVISYTIEGLSDSVTGRHLLMQEKSLRALLYTVLSKLIEDNLGCRYYSSVQVVGVRSADVACNVIFYIGFFFFSITIANINDLNY